MGVFLDNVKAPCNKKGAGSSFLYLDCLCHSNQSFNRQSEQKFYDRRLEDEVAESILAVNSPPNPMFSDLNHCIPPCPLVGSLQGWTEDVC
jgi:hypothetical protein